MGQVEDLSGLMGLFLPEGVMDYFDFIKCLYDEERMIVILDEKNIVPAEFKSVLVKAAGFTEPRTLKDFPIRGRTVTLQVRRRRWEINTEDGSTKKVSRDWSMIQQGTNITIEFAAFLKALD